MKITSLLLISVARIIGWPSDDRATIESELNDLAELRHILTITQQQIDQLTADVTANADAIALAAQSIAPLQASIAAATTQIAALTDKLANAGVPFNSDALDAALRLSTSQVKALGDSLASVPTPAMPLAPSTDPAQPSQAVETVQVPS